MSTTTMRSGNGSTKDVFVGTAVVDEELNEVVIELDDPTEFRTRLTCGGLVPLDMKGQRVRVIVEVMPEEDEEWTLWDRFRRFW